jgi:hypothetical protein
MDVVEAAASEEQFAEDERCPTVAEELGADGDGAVLLIARHRAIVTRPDAVDQY